MTATISASEVHLRRAHTLVLGVEESLSQFRQQTIDHVSNVDGTQPLVQGVVGAFLGARRIKKEKSSLTSDLDLAAQEIAKARALDANAVVDTSDGQFGIPQLDAYSLGLRGQIEMIWGKPDAARDFLNRSINTFEIPDTHLMLGTLFESEYKPVDALRHFERCLEMDPSGELSVPALRGADAMRNYKKKFRGSWQTLLVLLLFPPAGILYFILKRK